CRHRWDSTRRAGLGTPSQKDDETVERAFRTPSDRGSRMHPPGVSPLGQLLRQARQAQGLSLRQAAQSIRRHSAQSLSWQYLADLEQGRRQPSLTVLGTLAQGLRLDLTTLLAHVGHVETTLRAYLRTHPDCARTLHTFLLTALQVDFAAWDRLTRQLQGWTQRPLPPTQWHPP